MVCLMDEWREVRFWLHLFADVVKDLRANHRSIWRQFERQQQISLRIRRQDDPTGCKSAASTGLSLLLRGQDGGLPTVSRGKLPIKSWTPRRSRYRQERAISIDFSSAWSLLRGATLLHRLPVTRIITCVCHCCYLRINNLKQSSSSRFRGNCQYFMVPIKQLWSGAGSHLSLKHFKQNPWPLIFHADGWVADAGNVSWVISGLGPPISRGRRNRIRDFNVTTKWTDPLKPMEDKADQRA